MTGEREPGNDFDLEPDRRPLLGLAYANGHFYVLYERKAAVHAYTSTGARVPERDFELHPSNRFAVSLAYSDGLFRVVQFNQQRSKVYAYTEAGEHSPAHDFDLDAASRMPSGIVHRAGAVYVFDTQDTKAYAYTREGIRRPSYDFAIEGGYASGIAYASGRFYVSYLNKAVALAYAEDGQRAPRYDFDASPGTNDAPVGLAYRNGKFYVVDSVERKVFVYSTVGAYLPDHDFELDGVEARMATFANGAFLATSGPGQIRAYDETGVRTPAMDLRTGTQYRATGIEYALGRLYVGDSAQRRLVAFTVGGERTPRYDIAVQAGPDGPRGFVYGHGRFYVGDWSNEGQIYAYDVAGRHLATHDFDLGEAFRGDEGRSGPAGMTYADGAIYVIERRGDRILPYPID